MTAVAPEWLPLGIDGQPQANIIPSAHRKQQKSDIALPLLARNVEIVGRDVWFLLARTSVTNAGPLDMNVQSTIRTNAESKWCWLKVAIN